MKTIIYFFLVVIFSFLSLSLQAQQDGQITFYQSISITDANLAILECTGPVEVKVWEKNYIKVHTNVSCAGLEAASLQHLAAEGRYDLVSTMGLNNFLTIRQPNTATAVKVNQKNYKEQIQYVVYVPSYLDIEIEAPNDLVADHQPKAGTMPLNLHMAYQE